MKNIFATLVVTLVLISANAQTKESVYSAIATDICKEIKEKQAELKKSADLQMDLGFMMMPAFLKHEDDLKKVIPDFDLSNQKQIENLGIEVGKKLISCPEFLSVIASNKDIMNKSDDDETESSIEGTLQSVATADFTSIAVKTTSGKIEKIWWMEYFPGDDKLSGNSLVNKKVTVRYKEKEVYNAAVKDYVKIKVITGIE